LDLFYFRGLFITLIMLVGRCTIKQESMVWHCIRCCFVTLLYTREDV